MAPRGRGGKFSKPTRGGGKHFSRDVQPVDKDGNAVGMWRDPDDVPSDEDDDDSDDDSDEESSDNNEAGPSSSGAGAEELTREQRKAAAKARKEAAIRKRNQTAAQPGDMPSSDEDDDEDDEDDEEEGEEGLPANPNHTSKSRSQAAAATIPRPAGADEPANKGAAPSKKAGSEQLTRREREALEAQQARERYMKLHMEGKTDEARADLERLRLVRERREAEKARRDAEREEKDAQHKERQQQYEEREKKAREAALGKPAKAKKGAKK